LINGKRVQRFFETRDDAENYLRETKSGLKSQGTESAMVSPSDRVLFSSWKERLEEAGSSIEEAAGTFLRWKAMFDAAGATVGQAGAFFAKHYKPLAAAPNLLTVAQEFIEEQTRVNSPKYLQDVQRPNMRSFLRHMTGKEIGDIKRDDVMKWMEAADALSTKRNRRSTAQGFFRFARTKKYVSESPIAGEDNIPLAGKVPGEVLSFGMREVRAIMHCALTGLHTGRRIPGGGPGKEPDADRFSGNVRIPDHRPARGQSIRTDHQTPPDGSSSK
jgi:hypothetical protein